MNKQSFKEKIASFMSGRYGMDELYIALFVLYIILFIINLFVNSIILGCAIWLLIIWAVFRSFSRNIQKRYAENQIFLKFLNPVKSYFCLLKNKFRDRKTHVYRSCPKCKTTLRFPRKKGIHTAVCPKCKNSFEVKINR